MIKKAYTVEQMMEQVGEFKNLLDEFHIYADLRGLSNIDEIMEIVAYNFESATQGWLNQQSCCARAEDKLRELGER